MSDNSSNNKRIAKNTLLLYARMLLTMAISLYTSRVILQVLGVENFGIYNVVGGVVAMFSFINGAMTSAIQRYITFSQGQGDIERQRKIFCTSVNVQFCIAILLFVLAESIGLWFLYNELVIPEDRFNAAFCAFQCSMLSSVVLIMTVPFNATIIAHERMSAFAYLSIVEVSLKLLVVYLLMLSPFDKLIVYAILILLVQSVVCMSYRIYCYRHFAETEYKFIHDKNLFREMVSFASWSLFGNMAAIAYTQGLNLMLNIFFGPIVNAARAVSVQVQNAITGFIVNFQTAINPQITKSYASGNNEYMYSLVYRSGRYSYFLMLVMTLPIIIVAPLILRLWLHEVPEHTVIFVRIMLVTSLIYTLSNPLIVLAQATGKVKKYQLVAGGVLLSILPISYVCLKLGAPAWSVFLVHACVEFVDVFVRAILLHGMMNFSIRGYVKNVIFRVIIVTFIACVIPILMMFLFDTTTLVCGILIGLVAVVSAFLAVFLLGITTSEKQQIIKLVKNRIPKIAFFTKKRVIRFCIGSILVVSIAANVLMVLPYWRLIDNRFKTYTSVTDSVEYCKLVRDKSIQLADDHHKVVVGYQGLLEDMRAYYRSSMDAINNNYHRGLLFTGLSLYAEAYTDSEVREVCANHLKSFVDTNGNFIYEVRYSDQALIGAAYCSMYRQTKEPIYKKAADNLLKMLKVLDDPETGILYRTPAEWQYEDVLGMAIPFLMEYSNTFNDSTASSMAYRNFNLFYKFGVDKETGMPCHGYNTKNHLKLGSMNWGRGTGWYLLAASYLPEFSDPLLDKNIQLVEYEQFLAESGGSFFDSSTALLFEIYKRSRNLPTRGIMFMQPHTLENGLVSDISGDTYFLNKYSSIKGEYEIGNGLLLMLLSKYQK